MSVNKDKYYIILLQMSHVTWSMCLRVCLSISHTDELCTNG